MVASNSAVSPAPGPISGSASTVSISASEPLRVALVAPQSVPAVRGGAENLWDGLLAAFNQLPGVRADFISLPNPETTLLEVLQGYRRFGSLELSQYHRVFTTKYPAWALQHANQTVYLQHTLRGLYDTYPSKLGYELQANALQRLVRGFGLLQGLADALRLASQPVWATYERALAVAWVEQAYAHCRPPLKITAWLAEQLEGLCQRLSQARPSDQALLAFPGPFARACVRLLDALALSPKRIAGYSAISRTVAMRQDYFPEGVEVGVQHHPSFTAIDMHCEASQPHSTRDLIVTASRLDPPKRLDLLIQAYGQSGLTLPFWVVGTGPAHESLQALVAQTPGAVLKGYLSQQELVAAYQRAMFVPFAPYQEDYGLITVEAYMAGAAVITTSDAGGPTELVEHGQTGLVAEPNAASLAQAFRQLASPEMQAQRQAMAKKGQQQVRALQWPSLADWLFTRTRTRTRTANWPVLGMAEQRSAAAQPQATQPGQRPRLLVLNTFGIEPTVSGGRLRMKGLYTALSQWFDIHMLSLASPIVTPHLRRHSPWMVEELVPVASPLLEFEASLSRALGVSAFDLAVALRPDLLPDFQRAMERALRAGVEAVICSHPYCFPAYEQLVLQEPALCGPVVYEAHNVEWALKLDMFPKDSAAIHAVQALETRLLKQAQLVVASSDQDRVYFQDIAAGQGFEISKIVVANNAMQTQQARFISLPARKAVAEQQGFYLALFAGSWHGPNLQAVDAIIQAAERLAQNPQQGGDLPWRFVVLGSVGHAYAVKPPSLAALTTSQGVRTGLKHGWHQLAKELPFLESWLGAKGHAPRRLRQGPQESSSTIYFTGVVSDEEKQAWLARASVGLNPILTGSGTNLKMAEYAAWGLPILSTTFGARGGIWQAEQHYGVVEVAQDQDLAAGLINALNYFSQQAQQVEDICKRIQQARQVVHSHLDWQVSAAAMRQGLVETLGLVVASDHQFPFESPVQ